MKGKLTKLLRLRSLILWMVLTSNSHSTGTKTVELCWMITKRFTDRTRTCPRYLIPTIPESNQNFDILSKQEAGPQIKRIYWTMRQERKRGKGKVSE